MHGVRLQPGSTVIELRVRLFNRSDEPQTFLWWANVAAEVHADYQSFFPADVTVVADHAKRALSTFPAATGPYYGIDYPARRGLDTRADSPRRVPGRPAGLAAQHPGADLVHVPGLVAATSSAATTTGRGAGFVHWADHHYAVGKKQWTWGDDAFGHAWNRNLADDGAAYIELMAGVYTDNQPDFSHLAPGETKTFSPVLVPDGRNRAGRGREPRCRPRRRRCRRRHDRARFDATHDLGATASIVLDHDRPAAVRRPRSTCARTAPGSVVLETPATVQVELSRGAARPLLRWSDPDRRDRRTERRAARPAASSRPAPAEVGIGRGALSDRTPPGAVPARHPLARAVLARGACPATRATHRPTPHSAPVATARPATREAERHAAGGRRPADPAEPEPDRRRGRTTCSA